MMMEIERKFLLAEHVDELYIRKLAIQSQRIQQAYLNSNPDRTVRVRRKGEHAFLTVKGRSSSDGLSRYEWEKPISLEEAEELFRLCEPGLIDKMRYVVPLGQQRFEVDVFYANNQGLILAELELSHISESIERPSWLGSDVTGDARYYNSQLMKKPYSQW